LAITLRREWQAAQVSSSADTSGSVRRAMPVSGLISQWPLSLGFSQLVRPILSEPSAACSFAAAALAHATWWEPGPWHASQATSTSVQLVE